MNDLHFDSVGWPQEPLPVRKDATTLFPRLPRMVTRKNALDRHTRYRIRIGNERRREKYRLAKEQNR